VKTQTEELTWWSQFKEDFYMEVMRHNQEKDENRVNTTLISLARKHEVK
jgi:DNA polymerase-3 subunit alpha